MKLLSFNQIIRGGYDMATKIEKRTEARKQNREIVEEKTKKKELMSKGDRFKWMLFGVVLVCLWILAKFSA